MITAPTPVLKDFADQTEVRKAFSDLARSVNTPSAIIQPLTSIISSSQTYNIAPTPGFQSIYIPTQFLVSSSSSLCILTIQASSTGTTVTVPILPSGLTITSGAVLFNIYIDTQGNIASDDFSIACSSTAGKAELRRSGFMMQQGSGPLGSSSFSGGPWTTSPFFQAFTTMFPVPFSSTLYTFNFNSYKSSASGFSFSGFGTVNALTSASGYIFNAQATDASVIVQWTATGTWK